MPDGRDDAFHLIGAVSRAIRSSLDRRLLPHGLHAGQDAILGCLWERDGATPGQLARRLGLTTPTVTRAVQRMSIAGLVERRADDDDRRMVGIWLTPRGRALRRVVPPIVARARADAFADLSARDQALLAGLLGRVRVCKDD